MSRDERIRWLAARAFEEIVEAGEEERRDYLGGLDDPRLGRELEELLAWHDAGSEFLDTPATGRMTVSPLARGQTLGVFEVEREIGRGGMGQVFLARRADGTFRQRVAVKVLDSPWASAGAVRRFLRERQILADLVHPNVARLLDGGELPDGTPYLVMEHVDGRALDAYCAEEELSTEGRVRIVSRVARVVDSAHRAGVIHRDLKPANVLVTADGEPKLVDFGIASLLDAGPSQPRRRPATLGLTPEYASPQQLAGRPPAATDDVYSLGVVLSELLSGCRPPVLAEVEPGERQRFFDTLRRSVDRDLFAVLRRAVSPDPARRYASTGALADDLERWLQGEPPGVVPGPRLVARLRGLQRRRPLLTVLLAAAALALLVAVAVGVDQHLAHRRQLLWLQHFSERGAEVESLMRAAYRMPLHSLDDEQRRAREMLSAIAADGRARGDEAAAAAAFALGRGHLALGDAEQAVSELEEAWRRGLQGDDIAFFLGLGHSMILRRRLDELTGIRDAARRRQLRDRLHRAIGEPAIEYLRRADATSPGRRALLEGLVAYHSLDFRSARELARQASEHAPWLTEARDLEAASVLQLGFRYETESQPERAVELYTEAASIYRRALEEARSHPGLHLGACRTGVHLTRAQWQRGAIDDAEAAGAASACERALEVSPHSVAARDLMAKIHWRWGDFRNRRGEDPGAQVATIRRLGAEILVHHPNSAVARRHLGKALELEAAWTQQRGEDPRPLLDEAVGVLTAATELPDREPETWLHLGNVLAMRGRWEGGHGEDPTPTWERAAEAFATAGEIDPGYVAAFNNRGVSFLELGLYRQARGEDATRSLEAAHRALSRACRLDPSHPGAHCNLGVCYLARAQGVILRSDAGFELVARGAEALHRAVELRPEYPVALFNLASAEQLLGIAALRRDRDPMSHLRAAMAANGRVLELHPRYARALMERGVNRILAAEWSLARGEDPRSWFESAERDLGEAVELQPEMADVHAARARLSWRRALAAADGAAAARRIDEGLAACRRALDIQPGLPRVLGYEGALRLLRAEHLAGEERRREIERGRELMQSALDTGGLLFDEPELSRLLAEAQRAPAG